MARRFWVGTATLVLALGLAACSTARLAYNQAPNLTYWWLDGHVDFTSDQTPQVRSKIDAFFQWHRSNELPAYSRRLQAWQALALRDITPAEVCSEFDAIRQRIDAAAERMVAPLARMALQLDAEQLANLQKRQAKSNADFAKEHLQPDPEQALDERLKKASERSERFYGPLTTAQRELLREQLRRSPWNPERTQAERERRQVDLLKTVRELQANPAIAEQAVREHVASISRSPSPGYPEYSAQLVQHGCAQLAALHNSTTPEQRANAVMALKGYEDDVISLTASR
ncbi:MAG TPA: DUF6279 family lipoprotein [Hydrogenophaga sp.]|nr:DUF6279 family lipoprotein [Hydrogenophaga sp.]